MYDWSGFYIGMNGGWGQSSTRYDWANFLVRSDDASGGTVGGQIGYNWQAGSWVFGLEAQGNWADLTRSYVDPFDPRWSVGTTVDALGLFTGRVGYAANNVLFYVKGGAAVASNSYWAALNNVDFINVSNTRWGASCWRWPGMGLHAELVVRVEYNHLFLGDTDLQLDQRKLALYQRRHPAGHRLGHRPHQLSLRWPWHDQILILIHQESGTPAQAGVLLCAVGAAGRCACYPDRQNEHLIPALTRFSAGPGVPGSGPGPSLWSAPPPPTP